MSSVVHSPNDAHIVLEDLRRSISISEDNVLCGNDIVGMTLMWVSWARRLELAGKRADLAGDESLPVGPEPTISFSPSSPEFFCTATLQRQYSV
jgi:hypothetical protein